jgi:nucleoid DNA-binding protein
MASQIQAVSTYRPKIKGGTTVGMAQLVAYIASRTGLSDGEVTFVLKELRDAVIFFNRQGQGVKIEGLGTYQPSIKLNGRFDVAHRLDKHIKDNLNAPGTFTGEIENRANIGKTAADLVALWNVDHPEDPVS